MTLNDAVGSVGRTRPTISNQIDCLGNILEAAEQATREMHAIGERLTGPYPSRGMAAEKLLAGPSTVAPSGEMQTLQDLVDAINFRQSVIQDEIAHIRTALFGEQPEQIDRTY